MGNVKSGEFAVSRFMAWYILIICCLLYMVNYMDRQVFAVAVEPMKAELGLNDSQMGTIQTCFLLGMAFFSFPAAYMVDRWSRRKAISLMAVLWSAFTFLTGLGKSFTGILVPRTLVGVGEAGFTSGGTPLIAAAFPPEARSRVMGIFNLAIPLGSGLGMMLGGAIAKSYNWRAPFYAFAVPGIILGVLALFMKDYKTVRHLDESGRQISFFRAAASLFGIRSLKWMYLGMAMQMTLTFSFLSWAPAYIMRAQDVDIARAGMMAGIIGLMALFGSVIGGIIADAWQKRNERGRMYTAAISVALAAVLFLLSVLLEFKGIGFAVGIVFGMVIAGSAPSLSAMSQDVSPPSLKGVSWGMNVFCMYVFGGGYGPIVVGAVSDALGGGAHGLKMGLMLMAVPGIVSAVLYYMSARHYYADAERVRHLVVMAEE
jgi:MFS family permease